MLLDQVPRVHSPNAGRFDLSSPSVPTMNFKKQWWNLVNRQEKKKENKKMKKKGIKPTPTSNLDSNFQKNE